MARSYHVYTASAAQTDFTFSKPYISQSHVAVIVDDALQTIDDDYTWPDPTTIRFNSGLTGGENVELVRQTTTDILVQYTNASVLDDDSLTTAYRQAIYILEELLDDRDRALLLPRGVSTTAEDTLEGFVGNVYKDGSTPPIIVEDTFDLTATLSINAAGTAQITLTKDNTATTTVIEGGLCS